MGKQYDKVIIGGGLYGLYAALFCVERGQHVLVLEYDDAPFKRATYINQARVHMGYHYPRSLTTAVKSANYFKRFVEDYGFCIHQSFDQIYATSSRFSWTNAKQFMEFCKAAEIRCEEVPTSRYFNEGMCDGAYLTEEYTYDAMILKEYFLERLENNELVDIQYNARIRKIVKDADCFSVFMEDDSCYVAPFVLNATYASVNQLIELTEGIEQDLFGIKYELCEIILCEPSEKLRGIGLTVMDGPFFSIMPFGKTGYHSLTSVTFTPHVSSRDTTPTFDCQKQCGCVGADGKTPFCTPSRLGNCNDCPGKPETAWDYMSHLADKYMRPEYSYTYKGSLFSMKPVLKSSEVDDSRPTAIRVLSEKPTFVSVLSGKINTVYDLDQYLE